MRIYQPIQQIFITFYPVTCSILWTHNDDYGMRPTFREHRVSLRDKESTCTNNRALLLLGEVDIVPEKGDTIYSCRKQEGVPTSWGTHFQGRPSYGQGLRGLRWGSPGEQAGRSRGSGRKFRSVGPSRPSWTFLIMSVQWEVIEGFWAGDYSNIYVSRKLIL